MKIKLIIILIILLLIIGISVTGHFGSKDDAGYQADHTSYENAKNLLEQSKGDQAIGALLLLEKKHPNDYGIHKNLALAYGQSRQVDTAIQEFNAALKLRPSLIIDGLFSAQYADILYLARRNEEALVFYKNALKYNTTDQLTDYLNQQINTLSSNAKESESK